MMNHRWPVLALGLVLSIACGDDDASGGESGSAAQSEANGSDSGSTDSDQDGSASASATASGPDTTAEPTTDGGEGSSTAEQPTTTDVDPSASDTDPTTGDPTGDPTTSDSDSGARGGGTIDVTLSGCDVDLGGTVVVSYNGSLGVASVYDSGSTLTGSFQFDLDGPGTMVLSTQHRVDTGNVVNMVDIARGTWTNLDSDALTGQPDSIGGTLIVDVWEPSQGRAELELQGVSLLNVVSGGVCTIDGTITTTELYP